MNKLVVDLLQQKGLGCWKVFKIRRNLNQLTNPAPVASVVKSCVEQLQSSAAASRIPAMWCVWHAWLRNLDKTMSVSRQGDPPPQTQCFRERCLAASALPPMFEENLSKFTALSCYGICSLQSLQCLHITALYESLSNASLINEEW